mgnify:CR=1 FL=1
MVKSQCNFLLILQNLCGNKFFYIYFIYGCNDVCVTILLVKNVGYHTSICINTPKDMLVYIMYTYETFNAVEEANHRFLHFKVNKLVIFLLLRNG